MKTRNYNEYEVVKSLSKKNDLFIDTRKRVVYHLKEGKGDVGVGSKGKIDYLCNYQDYHEIFVTAKEMQQAKSDTKKN